ncbi:MAG: RDD family protein [Bacilli bacterium]|nr:RDD family protein [Bacilli bacterium]
MVIKRSLAYLVDLVILSIVYIILFFLPTFKTSFVISETSMYLFYTFYIVSYILYFCLLPFLWDGWTLSKRLFKIQMIIPNRKITTFLILVVKYFIFRFLLNIVTFGLFIIFEWIYIKKHKGTSFVDKILKTEVKVL